MKEYLGDGYEMEQAEMAQEAIPGGQVQDGTALRHERLGRDDSGSPDSDDVRGATSARGPLEIALPFPPSTNSIWRFTKAGGAYLSKPYKLWKAEADGMFLQQKAKLTPIDGHFEVFIVLDEKKRRGNRDADNSIKVCLDALQRWQLIKNDSLADTVCVRWGYAPDGCFIQVWPR